MGSFFSKGDPRNANDDGISTAGVAGAEVAAAPRKVGGVTSGKPDATPSSSSLSKRGSGEQKKITAEKVVTRRSSKSKSLPTDSTVSTKEKRKALTLIKHRQQQSKSRPGNRGVQRGRNMQRRSTANTMNSNDSRSGSSNATTRPEKENHAPTTQSRQGNNRYIRMPLDPISEKQDQIHTPKDPSAANSSAGKKKKICPAAPYNLRRNGSKSSSTDDNVAIETGMEATKDTATKVPIDPPGAILGALPMMHYSNGQQMMAEQNANVIGSHVYGGGAGHPMYQPVFPNWGYQPHHGQQQHGGHHGNAGHHPSQQWAIPPLNFLAPFAHFMSGNGGHGNTWTPTRNDGHMVHNARNVHHEHVHMESRGGAEHNGEDVLPSDVEDNMSVDESVASTDGTPEIKEVESQFIPSMFAPPEVVEKIRARNEASAKLNAIQPRQTRSMTAKKNSPKSMKTPAHQACSPKADTSQDTGKSTAVAGAKCPEPTVLTVLGKKVTMIDPVRKVFVIDLLSPETCDQIRMMADNHTREIHMSGSDAETWRTLYTYTKMDLPVVEVKDMVRKYTDQIMTNVKKIVGEIFGMKKEAMKLRPRSWKEPHLLLYQRLDDRPHHTGIEMHYDGCDITWQAMLARLDEYEGGGTYFRCLRQTVKLQQGQVLVHPGELYHKGLDITYGIRCLLVCFTDGMNPKILDDSKSQEDSSEYEKNVVVY